MVNSRPVHNWTDEDGHLEEHVLDVVWDRDSAAWLVVTPNRILRLHPEGGAGDEAETGKGNEAGSERT